MLKAVEKKRAYEDIVAQIRNLIEKGRLKRGDKLLTERELVDVFKVSRASVREAIRTLESMNLVESRQGTGTYVVASSEEALIQPLAAALFYEKDNLIDIFYIRKIIEPHVAQLAAEKVTESEIDELSDILHEQEEELAKGVNIIGTDSQFHILLAKMAKNSVLERLLIALVDLLGRTREKYLQGDERAQKSLAGHQEVLSAIKNRKGAEAHDAMLRHLDEVEKILFKRRD